MCNGSGTLFEWTVWKLIPLAGNEYKLTFPGTSVAKGTSEWTMQKLTLEYAKYMVEFRVTMVTTGTSNSDYKYLSIIESPLIAQISGGSHVKRGFNKLINLDASPSQDPDVQPGNYSGITFAWLCKKKDEIFPLGLLSSIPVIDPSGAKGRGGCFDTGIGKLSSTDRIVSINTGYMTVDNSYVVKLVVKKLTGRTSSFKQLLDVVNGDPPQISIR